MSEINTKLEKNLMTYSDMNKIFLDTSSLMCDAADRFMERMVPHMINSNNEFIIPVRVIRELEMHTSKEKRQQAVHALELIQDLRNREAILKTSYKMEDSSLDYIFLMLFMHSRKKFNLLLVTQDAKLASKMLKLNEMNFERANKILVKRIGEDGYLVDFEEELQIETNRRISAHPPKQELANYTDKCEVEKIPGEGELVYADKYGETQLVEKIGKGKEGIVYLTDFGYAAKIYKEVKVGNRDKIILMCQREIVHQGICWPIDILRNEYGEFVGFLMPVVQAKPMKPFIEISLKNRFPHWQKADAVRVCIDILEKMEHLHSKNILMGDINLLNIMIDPDGEVFFVDTDSYQIDHFPCPVGTQDFTSREIFLEDEKYKKETGKNRSYSQYLRTRDDEYFALAVLLFEILFFEKHPYARQGGNSVKENIVEMEFVYPPGEEGGEKVPIGPYIEIWNHLTPEAKQAFYDTFAKDGAHSCAGTRLDATRWKEIMKNYLDTLLFHSNPEDKVQMEFYPSKWETKKMAAKVTRDPGSRLYMRSCCVQCGIYFDITIREKEFLDGRKKPMPDKCKKCR